MTKIVPSGAPQLAVDAHGLSKRFGTTPAVDRLSLAVPAGAVYALLGPNGAGKSTVIRILATLIRPDAGTARVLGRDVVHDGHAIRARIALTGQFASVDEDLTGGENLLILALLHGFPRRQARARADELLDSFDLRHAATRQVKTYSGGVRRRLDIAASMIATPELLFLDEPTTGLDPFSRSQVWEMVRRLVDAGTTVLLTTQYLDEADRLATRIGVIDQGRLIAEGTSGELKASLGQRLLRVRLRDPDRRADCLSVLSVALDHPVQPDSDPAVLTARLPVNGSPGDEAQLVGLALSQLAGAGVTVSEIGLDQPSLDDVFLSMTGPAADPVQE